MPNLNIKYEFYEHQGIFSIRRIRDSSHRVQIVRTGKKLSPIDSHPSLHDARTKEARFFYPKICYPFLICITVCNGFSASSEFSTAALQKLPSFSFYLTR